MVAHICTIEKAFDHAVIPILIVLAFLVVGCAGDQKSDAYGQFEATETTVSSELAGKLLSFEVEEGIRLEAGRQVGLVDTATLALLREELNARLESTRSRIENINAEVQESELESAQNDLHRIQLLHEEGAATQKELDDSRARVRTLQRKIDALRTQKQTVRSEVRAIRAQKAQLREQINDARIINPVKGTVLTTFAEPFEMVQPGQPLYRIARLDTLVLRAYLSGAQLPELRLGRNVEVLVDKNAEENRGLSGRVSWISSEAEFTPKMIQTKEERVTQVYAFKVRVPNTGGLLKIGMPGEVNLHP